MSSQKIRCFREQLEKTLRLDCISDEMHHALLALLVDVEDTTNLIKRGRQQWVTAMDAMTMPVFLIDPEYRIVRANQEYAKRANMDVRDVIGRPYWQTYPKLDGPPLATMNTLLEHQEIEEELTLQTGEILYQHSYTIYDEKGQVIYTLRTLDDITEQRNKELNFQRINNNLRILHRVNQTLTHSTDEQGLMNDICRILVEEIEYCFVSIGFVQLGDTIFNGPVAFAGEGVDFLGEIVGTCADANCDCPIGMAIHTLSPVLIEDIANDTLVSKSWKEAALKQNFRSCMLIPLIVDEQLIGIINVYSDQLDTFNQDLQSLLNETADDLAFGIDSIRNHDETQQNKMQMRTIIDNNVSGIMVLDEKGTMKFANLSAQQLLGRTQEQIEGHSFGYPVAEDEVMELQLIQPGNDVRTVEMQAAATTWHNKPAYVVSLQDITLHKELETERLEHASHLDTMLVQTIQAMASALEKRDPYTGNHQQRVSQLAVAIAQEMELSEKQIKGILLGGLIHDIGKIYVPAEILSRPGKLGSDEYELIKTHSEIGYEIIKDIDFTWPIAKMVLQHHERLDGSGYPHGLKRDEIILESKILAVADVVEAIMSHRPYRPALGPDLALDEIQAKREVHYDPQVVDACVHLFRDSHFTFEDQFA